MATPTTTATQSLPLIGGPVTFSGAVDLEQTDRGVQPWRLPLSQRDLFEPHTISRLVMPAGVRLTFTSNTQNLTLALEAIHWPVFPASHKEWTIDLLVDGGLHQRVTRPLAEGAFAFSGMPHRRKLIEVYLHHMTPVRVRRVDIDEQASAKAWRDRRPRWVVYGSSITHCSAALPSETWPALVARRFGLNLTCMGVAGGCHMEPMVSRLLRDLPADYIGLCLGINVMGESSLSDRTFRAAVIGVIKTLRDRHRETPVAVVSPTCNPSREETPNAVGMTLKKMRKIIAAAVESLRAAGDKNLHYVDGLELFGLEYVKGFADQLHPDAEGYRVLADRYAEVVMPRLGLSPEVSKTKEMAGVSQATR